MNDKERAKEELTEKIREANECLKEEIRRVKKMEAMRKRTKRVLLALLTLLIVVFQYLYFSSPGRVVVNRNGEIHGLVNQARATFQGKKFWRDQLHEVKREIRWEESGPLRRAENERTLERFGRDANRGIEEFYEKYPQFRPSKAELQAAALRGQADQIKWTGFNRILEEMRRKRIEELRNLLPVLQSKAE